MLCLPFWVCSEKLLSTSKDGNEIEVDRKGFDIWKKMSKEVWFSKKSHPILVLLILL